MLLTASIIIVALIGLLYFLYFKFLKEVQSKLNIYTTIFNATNTTVNIIDLETNTVLFANQVVLDILNISLKDIIGKTPPNLSPKLQPDGQLSSEKTVKMTQLALENGSHTFEWLSLIEGVGTLLSTVTLVPIDYKGRKALFATGRLIEEEKILKQKNAFQAQILEQIEDAVIATDLQGNIINWNQGAQKMLSYHEDEILGQSMSVIHRPQDIELNFSYLQEVQKNGNIKVEAILVSKDNQHIEAEVSSCMLTDTQGKTIGFIGICRDISTRLKAQRELLKESQRSQYLANHDILTTLPNRALFNDRLSQAMLRSKRSQNSLALFFIDVDNFKQINDSMGHLIGDEVLCEVSRRIKSILREEDVLARFGGDEFTLLLEDIQTDTQAEIIAQKILEAFVQPFEFSEQTLYVTCSLGICLYPDFAKNIHELLMYADTAMYQAKDSGRNTYKFFVQKMSEHAIEHIHMVSDLKNALKNEEFIVYYQAQIDADKNTIVGMEALIRWKHPKFGLISPYKFIPLAEETGFIVDIDRWVMKTAMAQIKSWYTQGLTPGTLALNLAIKQLHKVDFIDYVKNTLTELDFNPLWLELEVTEGQLMQNPEEAIHVLKELTALGIELAIDDFGTGYSSLSYLKRLPLDKLKIDQSFVKNICTDKDDEAIAKTVIGLAKNLNLDIIAEGVEHESQQTLLLELGCHNIQGYLHCKPIPNTEMEDFLTTFRK